MSFPTIPPISDPIYMDRDAVITLLLASIAFEELGLAHLINAEAEKIQFVLGTLPGQTSFAIPTIEKILDINRSVLRTHTTSAPGCCGSIELIDFTIPPDGPIITLIATLCDCETDSASVDLNLKTSDAIFDLALEQTAPYEVQCTTDHVTSDTTVKLTGFVSGTLTIGSITIPVSSPITLELTESTPDTVSLTLIFLTLTFPVDDAVVITPCP